MNGGTRIPQSAGQGSPRDDRRCPCEFGDAGLHGLATIALVGAQELAAHDPLGAAIHARFAAAAFAMIGWENVRRAEIAPSDHEAARDGNAEESAAQIQESRPGNDLGSGADGRSGRGETHSIEAIFDNGFPTRPAWKVACECGWECWDQPSEIAARSHYATHADDDIDVTGDDGFGI